MHPILIGVQDVAGGLRRFVFSVAPGQRVTVTGPAYRNTEDLAAELAATVVPVLARQLEKAGSTQ